jgi:hypothetical protein
MKLSIDLTQNISFVDSVLGHFHYLNLFKKFSIVKSILRHLALYNNYLNVLINKSRDRYPIEAKLRNGKNILLRNKLEAQLSGGRLDGFEYDTHNDIVTLSPLPYSHTAKQERFTVV